MHTILCTSGNWAINGVLVGFAVVLLRDLVISFSPHIKQGHVFTLCVWIKAGLSGLIIGGILGALRGIIPVV